jgi:5-methylcytosine-specific restriction endonuclease McrA
MRSGAVIQRVGMAGVPTGYLGPEKENELNSIDEKTPREAISKSRRFDIMKRDDFRCQLCGATQEQGAMLHVDHKVPLPKGGSNEDSNLWTLCDFCNLGKSDKTIV